MGKKMDIDLPTNTEELNAMVERMLSEMPAEDRESFVAMFNLAVLGVEPEAYAEFYNMFYGAVDEVMEMDGCEDGDEDDFGGDDDLMEPTLLLRIQMKGVTKPPMWREVEVPSDYDFLQLHEIIQTVTGLEDYHLWQFNRQAYNNSLAITFEEESTHDPEETLLAEFLYDKGDKLEYVYDYGDDWIFTVEVKDVIEKEMECPRCVKFKSDLNALEDMGGPWGYMDIRQLADKWDDTPKAERKKQIKELNFSSEEEFLEFIDANKFDLEAVNADLSSM